MYIKQDKRDVLDSYIDDLLNGLRELESDDPTNSMEENIGYVFFKMLVRVCGCGDFDNRSDAIKILECVSKEFYRKHVANHEDQKEFENGTVD